jgi:hypothetical protein
LEVARWVDIVSERAEQVLEPVIGPCEDDPPWTQRLDPKLLGSLETGLGKDGDRNRDLMLATQTGNPRPPPPPYFIAHE